MAAVELVPTIRIGDEDSREAGVDIERGFLVEIRPGSQSGPVVTLIPGFLAGSDRRTGRPRQNVNGKNTDEQQLGLMMSLWIRTAQMLELPPGYGLRVFMWPSFGKRLGGRRLLPSWETAHRSVDIYAEDLSLQLAAEHSRAQFLLGHSLGAYMALRVAESAARNRMPVQGLCALAPAAGSDEVSLADARKGVIGPALMYYHPLDIALNLGYGASRLFRTRAFGTNPSGYREAGFFVHRARFVGKPWIDPHRRYIHLLPDVVHELIGECEYDRTG